MLDEKLAMGWRDIRKVLRMPSSIRFNALGGLALVVVAIVAAERVAVELGEGGVVGDGDERGNDGFAEQLGEGLALLIAALALSFEAMPEDLVKEDGGGAPAENRGAVEGFGDGSAAEGFEVLRHGGALFEQKLLGWQVGELIGLEGLDAEEVHSVGSTGAGDDDQSGYVVGGGDAGALGGDEVVGLVGGREVDAAEEDVGVLLEEAGELTQACLPRGLICGRGMERRKGRGGCRCGATRR